MTKWVIFYGDGSLFSNNDGPTYAAPGRNVAVILQEDKDVGRSILHRWDWYYWNTKSNRWWGGDVFGILDQFTHDRENILHSLKQGGMVECDIFNNIVKRALNYPGFPSKSAKKFIERCEGIK